MIFKGYALECHHNLISNIVVHSYCDIQIMLVVHIAWSVNSFKLFLYECKLVNKDPNPKELVIVGLPCIPLFCNY